MTLPRSMDNFGPEDMAIPELKLIQNVGGDWAKELGAKPGDFFLSLSDKIFPGAEGLDITLVDIQKMRTYWGRTDIEDAPPECTSSDMLYGTNGEECAACEHRSDTPWLLDNTERRQKCTIDYSLIAIHDGLPMLVRAGGISATPIKELVSQLRLNKELKGEYHRAKIHVSGIKKKTTAGEAFALHFRTVGLVQDPKEVESLKLQSAQILGLALALPQGPVEKPEEPEPKEEPSLLDTDF